jgi:AcrR family transcriptional regulator
MLTKKKKSDTADPRELLLQTASRLFAEKGFEAVSIREIAKQADDTNIAMIAYYFGSKDGLFKAMIEERFPKTVARLQAIHEENGDAWDKISAIIDLYVERITGDGSFHKIVFRELTLTIEHRSVHRELILSGIEQNWQFIIKYIKEGQGSGLFKADIDPEFTLASVFGTIFQLINMPSWTNRLLGEKDEEYVMSDAFRNRLRTHLKTMMKAHLFA